MATVLKRKSEFEKIRKKIERKEKIEKIMMPLKKVWYKTLFVLFTLCVLAGTGVACVSTFQKANEISLIGAILVCILLVLLVLFVEIRAWKACKIEKKKKKDVRVIGAEGEEKVTEYIEKNFSNNYFLLNDINIRSHGKSSQFDHILVGPGGIFCLETKNYSGSYRVENGQWIFFAGKEKKSVESPQEQSCYHVSVLSELLYLERKNMVPLVVFANEKAKFDGDNKPCPVIHLNELKKTISSYQKIYTKKEAEKIAKKILSFDVGVSKFSEKNK